ncbi:polyketide cyclase [Hymenobacter sp. GOD-10R]|uniref:polyketide cyclase n=1 Tax=Hymenobacter sp. GOD-10R TaxID=3093922 RepID=UPI002D76CC84|nr:polyketide cyclase [Hymenobacter sp. GOD-10R]WRQ31054.1 polyketide cyclase [Hymenobacter sp. GOD-10R]
MKTILSDKSFRLAIIISLTFLFTGFLLLHFHLIAYGWAFFILLPIVTGIAIGALPSIKWAYRGLAVGLAIFLMLLLVGQLEGLICVLMALPIIVSLLFLGSVISLLLKRFEQLRDSTNLNTLALPFFLFLLFAPVDKKLNSAPETIAVSSVVVLPYSPAQVYEQIKSVDTLNTHKPFLLRIGLPVPQKCVLEREQIGGLRTCYFEGGKIVERITALQQGKLLKMDVISYQLTGRKWLGFREAIYLFELTATGKTKLIRTTTYTSELKPRAYWEPLEQIAIEQEHQYVFDNLAQDLAAAYRRGSQPQAPK